MAKESGIILGLKTLVQWVLFVHVSTYTRTIRSFSLYLSIFSNAYYTQITEGNLFAFFYRPFYEYFCPIYWALIYIHIENA